MAPILSIAGGGLAGLACGIRLQERGWRVTVHERQRYPLKKVCGEFLSPQAWRRVQGLGAEPHLGLPPRPLRRARFYGGPQQHVDFALEPQAWGLSRSALDSALAARFRQLGGDLCEGSLLHPQAGQVDASGRPPAVGPAAWMGWKAYLDADDAQPELQAADLLMLPLPQGYAGLARIEDGRWSLALLARTPARLPELLQSHPLLAALAPRLQAHAAIAGFGFAPAAVGSAWRIGDARRVWPPVTGDGMAQALLSGESLAERLADGKSDGKAGGDAGAALRQRFGLALQGLMLWPSGRQAAVALGRLWPASASAIYRFSRG